VEEREFPLEEAVRPVAELQFCKIQDPLLHQKILPPSKALKWASSTWLAASTQMGTSRQPEALALPSLVLQNVCNVFHMLA